MTSDSNNLSNYSTSFEDRRVRSYSVPYSVNCSSDRFESQSYSSSFDVELNGTLLSLRHTLEGTEFQSSLVISDINKDGLNDILMLADNGSGRIMKLYAYNESEFILNESMSNSGSIYGSGAAIDYDKDGDFEISQTGNALVNIFQSAISRLLKNI